MLDGSRDAASAMDAIYRSQRHIYDASRKYYLLGRDRMLAGLQPPAGGTVLEVGCGTGRNLVLAARRYPQARFYGFDVSSAMLETAAQSIARSGQSDRIVVAQADAARFEAREVFGIERFDRVYISYTLSMIPPWREAMAGAFGAVASGGSLHIVDFGGQSELPHWFRRGLGAWLAKFSVTPRADLERELRVLQGTHGATLRFERPYRDYACLAVLAKP